jgi:hypothetical protein
MGAAATVSTNLPLDAAGGAAAAFPQTRQIGNGLTRSDTNMEKEEEEGMVR